MVYLEDERAVPHRRCQCFGTRCPAPGREVSWFQVGQYADPGQLPCSWAVLREFPTSSSPEYGSQYVVINPALAASRQAVAYTAILRFNQFVQQFPFLVSVTAAMFWQTVKDGKIIRSNFFFT